MSIFESATDHAVKNYLPEPKENRRGLALALSGGGYRAALFDLGSLRRLNEVGVLTRLDTITSVSGGSVAASALARHRLEHPDDWRAKRRIPRFEEEIAAPLRAFTKHDIRTRAILARFYPWNWFHRGISFDDLAAYLTNGPAGPYSLTELGSDPSFILCATELRFRAQWQFDTGNARIGSDLAGYAALSPYWTLARAAAASASFPFAFPPVHVPTEPRPLGTYKGPDRDALVQDLELTDGGVYDNLGLEPVWRDHAVLLVSDASPTFKYAPAVFGLAWRGLRYAVTLLEQATDVRKRWLISSFLRGDLSGAYWSISSLPSNFGHTSSLPVYSDSFIKDVISQIRIDFDSFSEAEISVLENQGYILTEIALRRHAPDLIAKDAPEAIIPHPAWMDEAKARRALKESAKTEIFARYR